MEKSAAVSPGRPAYTVGPFYSRFILYISAAKLSILFHLLVREICSNLLRQTVHIFCSLKTF